jgi:hypothetical protein
MKYIYLVATGEYDDYQILAAFSSKKRAKEYMATLPKPPYECILYYIEQYEINPKIGE